jgi:hypothetical protein
MGTPLHVLITNAMAGAVDRHNSAAPSKVSFVFVILTLGEVTWHLDEVFVTLRGEPYLLWRAVDQHGAELDILLQKRRDKAGR